MRDDLQVSGGRAATAKQPPRRITLRIRVSIGLAVLVGATLASVPMATDAFASGPTITALTFGGSPSSPTVTVWGSGFGTYADLGTPQPAGGTYDCVSPPYSGSDYQNNMYFNENSQAVAAGTASVSSSPPTRTARSPSRSDPATPWAVTERWGTETVTRSP